MCLHLTCTCITWWHLYSYIVGIQKISECIGMCRQKVIYLSIRKKIPKILLDTELGSSGSQGTPSDNVLALNCRPLGLWVWRPRVPPSTGSRGWVGPVRGRLCDFMVMSSDDARDSRLVRSSEGDTSAADSLLLPSGGGGGGALSGLRRRVPVLPEAKRGI